MYAIIPIPRPDEISPVIVAIRRTIGEGLSTVSHNIEIIPVMNIRKVTIINRAVLILRHSKIVDAAGLEPAPAKRSSH